MICFDPVEQRFDERVPDDTRSRWVPLYETSRPSSASNLEVAYELRQRLWEYQVAGYIFTARGTDVPLQIFERLNSSGKALKAAEVFDALHRSITVGKPSTLRETVTELVVSFLS